MGLSIISNPSSVDIFIPISFIFWGYVIAYVIHILDESLLGETFVGMVKSTFFAQIQLEALFWI